MPKREITKAELIDRMVRSWYPPEHRYETAKYCLALAESLDCHETFVRTRIRYLKASTGDLSLREYLNDLVSEEIKEKGYCRVLSSLWLVMCYISGCQKSVGKKSN